MQETVASALAQLARADSRAAQVAETALSTLTDGRNLEALTQHAVQEFCWYVLPVRFSTDSAERLFAARSLGRLFALLGLDRYAAICTSTRTRQILEAYRISHDSGRQLYRRAMRASCVEPPDLPELTWGSTLGSAEIDAFQATSAGLELAVALDDIRPGTPGWRAAQQQQARAFLTQPDFQGRSRLDRVREERVRAWLESPSHPHRQRLWPLLGQLITGAETPPDAGTALAPVVRLLDYADDGIGLTQIGYISPSVVRELCAEFEWTTSPAPPRSETDVTQLIALHKLLRTMRAVRRSGRRLVLTRRGRHLHADTEALWRAVAESVLDTDGFAQAATETLLGLLLSRSARSTGVHARKDEPDLAEEARLVLADSGWGHDGRLPDTQQVGSVLITVTWLLETLGFVVGGDLLGGGGRHRLTKAGHAFSLTAMHLSATTPPTSL
ncbi:hypothetical protein LG943_01540 [Streptomonospora sp. S1-112]|uniref:Uncharacterized protein n=1 Tax=Streptomonospora mangrovi TaxID=2883123 RepID=A0A9X3SDT8_9ACTN|nr:hypothetical protein [Streptomonospora mangrovi]MDA0563025.1 hypothetical protein [Streptomonospora mangrovi]